MHSKFGNTYVCESTFYTISKSNEKHVHRFADIALHNNVRDASITCIHLIEICNKLLFASV